MVVADGEVGDSWNSTYHANQFLSSLTPPLVEVGLRGHACSFTHVPSESRSALGLSGMEEMGGTSCVQTTCMTVREERGLETVSKLIR